MKKSFILYENYWNQLQLLNFDQCGRLLMAVFAHECGKKLPELDSLTQMLFSVIADQLDRDREKYEDMSKRRSEAGRKGGIASGKARAVSSCEANEANASDNDNENENEKETVNENKNKNENEKENENENAEADFEDLPPDIDPKLREIYYRIMTRRYGEKRLQNRLKQNFKADRKQDRAAEKSGFV